MSASLEANKVADKEDDEVRVENLKHVTLDSKYCSSCTIRWIERTMLDFGPIICDPVILETKEATKDEQATNEAALCGKFAAWGDKINDWCDKFDDKFDDLSVKFVGVIPGLFFVAVVNFVLFLVLRDSYVRFVFWSDSLPTYGNYVVATLQTVVNTVDMLIWNTVEALTKTWQSIPTSFRRNVAVMCSNHEEQEEEQEEENE